MARETKTIQCYPDDDIINKRVKRYEAFGWELINNQRCQEFEGQTKDYEMDGTTTINHYSTFNKLTFSRDKSVSWYSDVVALENECISKERERDRLNNLQPDKPTFTKTAGGFFLNVLTTLLLLAGAGFLLITLLIGWGMFSSIGIACLGVSILIIIARKVRKSHIMKQYESDLAQWRINNSSKIEEIENECKKIMEKSEALINAWL